MSEERKTLHDEMEAVNSAFRAFGREFMRASGLDRVATRLAAWLDDKAIR